MKLIIEIAGKKISIPNRHQVNFSIVEDYDTWFTQNNLELNLFRDGSEVFLHAYEIMPVKGNPDPQDYLIETKLIGIISNNKFGESL